MALTRPAPDEPGLALTMAGMKLRTLANTVTSPAGHGLVAFTAAVAVVTIATVNLMLRLDPDERAAAVPALTAVAVAAWIIGPIIFDTADGSIDPRNLTLMPHPTRRFLPGLVASSCLSPGAAGVGVVLVSVVVAAPNPAAAAVAAAAGVVTFVMMPVTAGAVLTFAGSTLRSGHTRTAATVCLLAGVVGITLAARSVTRAGLNNAVETSVTVTRWFPGGWPGHAVTAHETGRPAATIGYLAAAVVFTWTAGLVWGWALDRSLTETVDNPSGTDRVTDPFTYTTSRTGLIGIKDAVYLFRHQRHRVNVASQIAVLLVAGTPLLVTGLTNPRWLIPAAAVPALTIGVPASNTLGLDGRALWAETLTVDSFEPILRGRAVVYTLIGGTAGGVSVAAAAVLRGGWERVPAAVVGAFGMAFVASAVGSFTSTLAPVNVPDGSEPNPFTSGHAAGQGCMNSLVTLAGSVVITIGAFPLIAGTFFTPPAAATTALFVVFTVAYSVTWFGVVTTAAAARADHRTPELLGTLD